MVANPGKFHMFLEASTDNGNIIFSVEKTRVKSSKSITIDNKIGIYRAYKQSM